MGEGLILLATNFLWGAYHAVQPGHGKTIAAAYIVGARGRPVDAWILGIFVTLSHTSGIVLVGVLASLGLPGLESRRIEVWLKLLTGALVIGIGLWTLWTQRELFGQLGARIRTNSSAQAANFRQACPPEREPDHERHLESGPGLGHKHDHADGHANRPAHAYAHDHGAAGFHSHGFGVRHRHDLTAVMSRRPSLLVLVGLGIAGGVVPDPLALSLLIRALAEGKVVVGLVGVFAFSVGFAAVLVAVGVAAAAVGKRLLQWLAGPQAARLQVGMSLLIVLVGVILTISALGEVIQVESVPATG